MQVKTTMGEKLKDLRVERGLTTKQLCEMTQISEAVYNGLENDSPRDTGYSRIITLAKFFDVPTDYLLGFTESRITKNIELKELGLSDDAVEVLMRHKQDNLLVSELIEHGEFTDLMNAIDVYVRRVAAPNLAAMNGMINMAQSGLEMMFKDEEKPEGYDSAMRYITETQVNEDEFIRFRISERFNRILRDIYKSREPQVDESVQERLEDTQSMSEYFLKTLEDFKHGKSQYDRFDHALQAMWETFGINDEDVDEDMINRMWEEADMDDVFRHLTIADLEIISGERFSTDELKSDSNELFKPDLTKFTPPVYHHKKKCKRKR